MGVNVKHGIAKVLFQYWLFVILWQTFRPVENRSLLDTAVKIFLFGTVLLHGFYNRNTGGANKTAAVFALFIASQVITISQDKISFSASSLITIAFMLLQISVFLIMQHDEEISLSSLEWLGEMIVLTAAVMGGYSILFKTARFVRAFTSPGAYGSECRSFLYSNHEYALYLSAAIIFAAWLRFRKRGSAVKFALTVSFLGINLISTFSRTAIIGCIASLVILSFSLGGRSAGKIVCSAAAAAGAVLTSETVRRFVFQKILKNTYSVSGSLVDRGRSQMYREELEYFIKGSWAEKLFGHGYNGKIIGGHDAYLVILNTGGIVMFFFFLVVILWSLNNARICFQFSRSAGALCFSLQTLVLLYMVAQTPILFYSTMDSFFITMLSVIIPFYSANYLKRTARIREMNVYACAAN